MNSIGYKTGRIHGKMQHINLTSARKLKADEKIDKLGENSDATSLTGIRRNEVSTNPKLNQWL